MTLGILGIAVSVMAIIPWYVRRMMSTFGLVALKCSNHLNGANGAMSQILATWSIAIGPGVITVMEKWDGMRMTEDQKKA